MKINCNNLLLLMHLIEYRPNNKDKKRDTIYFIIIDNEMTKTCKK
jgi:hypothetical protein